MANLPSKTISLISAGIKAMRPVHWVKNLSLFAGLIFTGDLFDRGAFFKVLWAFGAFSLAASATYVFNDILDAKNDRLHPVKKNRPIASGKLPIPIALLIIIFLSSFSLFTANFLSHLLFLIIAGYLLLQVAYSLALKNIAIIDILIIAAGFVIRVYAGALIIDAHLSVWFLLCVISLALFLASGKRMAEITTVETPGTTRKSLTRYPKELLSSYVTMFGNAAWMSWSLYTFFESPKASLPVWLFLAEVSKATTINKLLMITIPIVIFGIMRYESLIFQGKSETPEKLLLTDIPLIADIFLWTTTVVWILYSGISA